MGKPLIGAVAEERDEGGAGCDDGAAPAASIGAAEDGGDTNWTSPPPPVVLPLSSLVSDGGREVKDVMGLCGTLPPLRRCGSRSLLLEDGAG